MKKISVFLICVLSFLYLEILFKILLGISFLTIGLLPMFFFIMSFSSLLLVLMKLFPEKVNKIIYFIIFLLMGIWFAAQYVTNQSTKFFFDFGFATAAGGNIMEGDFKKTTFNIVIHHIPQILLFFLPLVIFLILKKKMNFKKSKPVKLILLIAFIPVWILGYKITLLINKNSEYSPYELVYKVRENNLNIEKLGVLNALYLDAKRTLFGFEESLSSIDIPKKNITPTEKTYDYNVIDIDLQKFYDNTADSTLKQMTQYFMNDTGTLQNEYTGYFKGKNLIYIMAESFNEIVVSEDLTPTLYKLIHSGFEFTDFYSPTIYSTIGGEMQLLTGLYPGGKSYSIIQHTPPLFTMGLGTMFKNDGYNTFAYHDHTYTFQGRNHYLPQMGFNNFKGCGNGLQNMMTCYPKVWPESDIEMIEATVPEYINSEEPFMVFYATVSGHGDWILNSPISKKYKTEVIQKYPDYPSDVQAYIASQIELDKALEKLITLLEEAGKMDDTVIVLGGDHYPYLLTEDSVNNFLVRKLGRDITIGINHSNVIIWNNQLEHKEITKTMSTIDVLPTVYNLFGLKYDSRMIIGKDVFAPGDGLAMFGNKSWVTDKGSYYTSTGKFVPKDGVFLEDEKAYIKEINAQVKDKINISGNLVVKGYYAKVWQYVNS